MIRFSDNFTFAKLLRFTLPSIVMLIFTSVYTIVDGFFVSNFAGKAEFTALNFIFPLISILGSFGFLFGTGGGALTAKTMGEGNREKACQTFSLIVYTSIGFSVVAAAAGLVAIRPITIALGAEGELFLSCNTNSRFSFPLQENHNLAFTLPCRQGLPTSFWTPSLWLFSTGDWKVPPPQPH